MSSTDCDLCDGTGFVGMTDENGVHRLARCKCRLLGAPLPDTLSGRYAEATIATLPATLTAQASGYPARSLYIGGNVGAGKTWAAVALARRQPYLRFVWWPEWTARHRVLDHESPRAALTELDKLVKAHNLVLDDVGAETESDYGRRLLGLIIEPRRDDSSRATILTGNYTVSELSERYDDRVASRVVESMAIVMLRGDDQRLRRRTA